MTSYRSALFSELSSNLLSETIGKSLLTSLLNTFAHEYQSNGKTWRCYSLLY